MDWVGYYLSGLIVWKLMVFAYLVGSRDESERIENVDRAIFTIIHLVIWSPVIGRVFGWW